MIIQKTNTVLYIPITVNSTEFPQDYKKALNFYRKNHCYGVTTNNKKQQERMKEENLVQKCYRYLDDKENEGKKNKTRN